MLMELMVAVFVTEEKKIMIGLYVVCFYDNNSGNIVLEVFIYMNIIFGTVLIENDENTCCKKKPQFECDYSHGTYLRRRLIRKQKSDRLNQTRIDIAQNSRKFRLQHPVLSNNCRTVKYPAVNVAGTPWSFYPKKLNDVVVKQRTWCLHDRKHLLYLV